MTTLATYAFASNANLSGVVVRAYACGRYLNNSGSAKTCTITTSQNGAVLCSESLTVPSSPIAQAFFIWAHFYFAAAIPAAGMVTSIGSNLQLGLSNAYATATTTGAFVAQQLLQCLSNPYIIFINPALQTTLSVDWTLAGGDVLEVHAGYMEAL